MKTPEVTAPDEITVRVLKYDGTEYRRWNARLVRHEGSLLVLAAEFEFDVEHHLLGRIQRGTRTIEYYWLDRWYNVFRFLDENEETGFYYCNVSMPPSFHEGVLRYIDLDVDVLVQPDLSYKVVDIDDFKSSAERFNYSAYTKQQARDAIDELRSLIEARRFPFDGSA